MTLLGCTSTADSKYSWGKKGVSNAQLVKDDGECDEFVEKLVRSDRVKGARKTRYVDAQLYDVKGGRLDNRKNRKLVKMWCMQNRGYEKQVL